MLNAVNNAAQGPQPSGSGLQQQQQPQPQQQIQVPPEIIHHLLNNGILNIGAATISRNNRVGPAAQAHASGSSSASAAGVGAVHNGRGRRMRVRNNRVHNTPFENMVQDFLINVTNGQGGFEAGGVPMFFVGNPEDYVHGREGLDTIVTQLLNQIDGTGPPPLPLDKIAEIPTVEVSAEQVAEKVQCSVCWENFLLGEPVQKLPCLVSVDNYIRMFT